MKFEWTVSIGQVLSTAVTLTVVFAMYGIIFLRFSSKHLSFYVARIKVIEGKIDQLREDLGTMNIALQLTDSLASTREEERVDRGHNLEGERVERAAGLEHARVKRAAGLEEVRVERAEGLEADRADREGPAK